MTIRNEVTLYDHKKLTLRDYEKPDHTGWTVKNNNKNSITLYKRIRHKHETVVMRPTPVNSTNIPSWSQCAIAM